jgi:hypothetical protein
MIPRPAPQWARASVGDPPMHLGRRGAPKGRALPQSRARPGGFCEPRGRFASAILHRSEREGAPHRYRVSAPRRDRCRAALPPAAGRMRICRESGARGRRKEPSNDFANDFANDGTNDFGNYKKSAPSVDNENSARSVPRQFANAKARRPRGRLSEKRRNLYTPCAVTLSISPSARSAPRPARTAPPNQAAASMDLAQGPPPSWDSALLSDFRPKLATNS